MWRTLTPRISFMKAAGSLFILISIFYVFQLTGYKFNRPSSELDTNNAEPSIDKVLNKMEELIATTKPPSLRNQESSTKSELPYRGGTERPSSIPRPPHPTFFYSSGEKAECPIHKLLSLYIDGCDADTDTLAEKGKVDGNDTLFVDPLLISGSRRARERENVRLPSEDADEARTTFHSSSNQVLGTNVKIEENKKQENQLTSSSIFVNHTNYRSHRHHKYFYKYLSKMSSWVQYLPDHPFPIQNLPYGVFTSPANEVPHIATAIGDFVVDLYELSVAGIFSFDASVASALKETTLNTFMSLGYDKWKATREALVALFSAGCPTLEKNLELRTKVLIPSSKATMHLAATIGDYTDFYASKEHASNLGKLFRPGQPPLMENWLTIPVGYHGRASSVVVSGTPLRRPVGQRKPDAEKPPVVGPTMAFDIELEMAAWIGTGNKLGDRISTEEARKSIFGYSLFNDWSARDIQRYEYVPLGPFLGKNFGSTIGAWIVTSFALEPFVVSGPTQDPAPLPYLVEEKPGNYNVNLYVTLKTKEGESQLISTTNYKYMYWSAQQMVAHHTINGCNLRAGDLLASGTISGPTPGSYGSLLEITWQGTQPIKLPSGAERKMLQDGDTIELAGECVGDGYRIGFGECIGTVLPALPMA